MSRLLLVLAFAACALCPAWAQWEPQDSGTDADLRGISAVSAHIAWASGTKGTVLKTVDRGKHWEKVGVAGAESLDFRDLEAFDENTAFVLSAGPGEQSRIYKTIDGGQHWQLQFTNREPRAFYDCFAFWDRTHGIALSDPVDGRFLLLSTADGKVWSPLSARDMPRALSNEGAFAASGTCLTTLGKTDVWFGTGGSVARVFHSGDRGETWTVAETPISSGAPSQGIFSIAFSSTNDGVIVGGDYKDPHFAEKNAAFTTDGGETWRLAVKRPGGYRSAVAVIPGDGPILITVGITGSDCSVDGGNTWLFLDPVDYNALSFASGNAGWVVGPKGKIAHFAKQVSNPTARKNSGKTVERCKKWYLERSRHQGVVSR